MQGCTAKTESIFKRHCFNTRRYGIARGCNPCRISMASPTNQHPHRTPPRQPRSRQYPAKHAQHTQLGRFPLFRHRVFFRNQIDPVVCDPDRVWGSRYHCTAHRSSNHGHRRWQPISKHQHQHQQRVPTFNCNNLGQVEYSKTGID